MPGTIVTPGLIDLHAHVFEGFASNGVHPDLGGVYAGVTTLVDAGSAGAATFEAPHSYPTGVAHVAVNGVLVVENGASTGQTPGKVIRDFGD